MSRSRVSRLLAALLAAWFTVVTVEPAAVHACAMHAHAGVGAAEPAPAGHAAAHAAGAHDGAPAPDDAHGCTCLGHCCGAAPLALGAEPPMLRLARVAVPRRPGRPAHEIVAARADLALPFATAPPVAPAA